MESSSEENDALLSTALFKAPPKPEVSGRAVHTTMSPRTPREKSMSEQARPVRSWVKAYWITLVVLGAAIALSWGYLFPAPPGHFKKDGEWVRYYPIDYSARSLKATPFVPGPLDSETDYVIASLKDGLRTQTRAKCLCMHHLRIPDTPPGYKQLCALMPWTSNDIVVVANPRIEYLDKEHEKFVGLECDRSARLPDGVHCYAQALRGCNSTWYSRIYVSRSSRVRLLWDDVQLGAECTERMDLREDTGACMQLAVEEMNGVERC